MDALDNLPTRFALNKACLDLRIPLVHGAVNGFQGQVMTVLPGQGPCLMCLYEGREYEGEIPVLGTTPGITGCIQATEVIKILTGLGAPLSGRLLLFDGREMRFSELAPARNPRCPHCGEPPAVNPSARASSQNLYPNFLSIDLRSALSASPSTPLGGEPSITPSIPLPWSVEPTRTCTGLAVAQKIRQTSWHA